jgi:hypothetical protein
MISRDVFATIMRKTSIPVSDFQIKGYLEDHSEDWLALDSAHPAFSILAALPSQDRASTSWACHSPSVIAPLERRFLPRTS